MSTQPLPEFDEVVARLQQDLTELESVSLSLKNVRSYAEALRNTDKRFSETLSQIHSIAQQTLEVLKEVVQNAESGFKDIIETAKNDLAQSSQSLSNSANRLEAELSEMSKIDFPKRFEDFRELLLSAQKTTENAAQAGLSARDFAEQAQNASEDVKSKMGIFETRVKDVERAVTLLQSTIGGMQNLVERGTEKVSHQIEKETAELSNQVQQTLQTQKALLQSIEKMNNAQIDATAKIGKQIKLNRYIMIGLFVLLAILIFSLK